MRSLIWGNRKISKKEGQKRASIKRITKALNRNSSNGKEERKKRNIRIWWISVWVMEGLLN